MQIADKVFVVTGAGNGMGRQVALGLARRGARIAAVDLDSVGLAGTAELASITGIPMSTHVLDLTDDEAVTALPDEVAKAHGQIDGLVNIAGVIHRFAPFSELSRDETDRIMAVNFDATVRMCRTFLPSLLTRPEANITNMSSLSALLPFASQTLYSASKGAVKQFSEGLYAELCDTNVHVVTVFPGNIDTNLTGNSGVAMLDAGDRKVRSATAEAAGKKIVDGIARDRFRVLIGTDALALDILARLSAKRATRLVAKQIKSVL
ncbi:short-chain dehydrogenase [Mycobacterium sp. 852002-51152_SCH6134967]|uniref:SDR family NAD(P)-dependent oxidoreductase n=1 Tax=Mycobacterium sp. 852002-51152_SCH6134967 TaxID=1834096 RepID=UPI0007FBD18F|nr:SDR family NAD(P)-dependent oxidoreductase [Mycobacterium sp. 852002-51152_SCH6134967]OBF89062.1 short-chain dehydrogenase [Mycobacterium sp. 852002-51152_SCH6134967]